MRLGDKTRSEEDSFRQSDRSLGCIEYLPWEKNSKHRIEWIVFLFIGSLCSVVLLRVFAVFAIAIVLLELLLSYLCIVSSDRVVIFKWKNYDRMMFPKFGTTTLPRL